MVSFHNHLSSYPQKHNTANFAYAAGNSAWQWANYHNPPNHQFLGEMDSAYPHAQMYYSPHHMLHPTTGAPSEWHSPTSSADFAQNAHQMLQQHHVNGGPGGSAAAHGSNSSVSSGSSSASTGPASGNTQMNENGGNLAEQHIAEGLPSPPITVSGSEISSPGAPRSATSPHHGPHHLSTSHNNNNSPSSVNNNAGVHSSNNNRSSPAKVQYEWLRKSSYNAQPTPGKTRTKDKYRVVYTDFQRLELEKEYCTSRYITIRRKSELATSLALSERQVKIWFQNRRAKERKQNKKASDPIGGVVQHHGDYANLMETKPKVEALQLQHTIQSMNSMAAMSMNPMSLHHHLHPLAVSAAAHSHQLHQPPPHPHPHSHMSAAAAAGVGSLPM